MYRIMGIIGGTGLYSWAGSQDQTVATRYGPVNLSRAQQPGLELLFIARHGRDHAVPPHRVNVRAQVEALASHGVRDVIGVFNVGALDPSLPAGTWVVPDDFLDFTRHRPVTFHDDRAVHVDLTEPFCPAIRRSLLATAPNGTRTTATYATTEGPRLETSAERKALRILGADVVGMTLGPEATLAREAGLCYASLCFVANEAPTIAGVFDATAAQRGLAGRSDGLRGWIERAGPTLPEPRDCKCQARGRAKALVAVEPRRSVA